MAATTALRRMVCYHYYYYYLIEIPNLVIISEGYRINVCFGNNSMKQ